MEQLIFVGIILLFSMLEAVARKKREGGEDPTSVPPTGSLPEVRVPRPPEARVPTPRVPSYDDDPSFDDTADAGSRGGAAGTGRTSSEGPIPVDVWEEIQAMARGGPAPVRKAPAPAPAPVPKRAPARVATREPRAVTAPMSTAARKTRAPAVPEVDVVAGDHAVHKTHPKFGTPVHDRLTGFDDTHKVRALSAEARALRTVLRGGGAPLKQAILLQEILGPPVSLKDDPSAG